MLKYFDDSEEQPNETSSTMTNPVSGTTNNNDEEMENTNNNNYHVDKIDLEQLDQLLAQQRVTDRDESMSQTQDTATQPQDQQKKVFVYRIELYRKFNSQTSIRDLFKSFYLAFRKVDPHAAIRPIYTNDASRIPSISAPTQVQKMEQIDLSRYHQGFVRNQIFSLTGKMVLESALEFDDLGNGLTPYGYRNITIK